MENSPDPKKVDPFDRVFSNPYLEYDTPLVDDLVNTYLPLNRFGTSMESTNEQEQLRRKLFGIAYNEEYDGTQT